MKSLAGEEAAIRQILQCSGLEPGHADPSEQMEVPQPSFALLDVGLQQINGLSVLLIFTAPLFHLLFDKMPRPTADHLPGISAMALLKQVRASGQKPSSHHGGANRKVLRGPLDAIFN